MESNYVPSASQHLSSNPDQRGLLDGGSFGPLRHMHHLTQVGGLAQNAAERMNHPSKKAHKLALDNSTARKHPKICPRTHL